MILNSTKFWKTKQLETLTQKSLRKVTGNVESMKDNTRKAFEIPKKNCFDLCCLRRYKVLWITKNTIEWDWYLLTSRIEWDWTSSKRKLFLKFHENLLSMLYDFSLQFGLANVLDKCFFNFLLATVAVVDYKWHFCRSCDFYCCWKIEIMRDSVHCGFGVVICMVIRNWIHALIYLCELVTKFHTTAQHKSIIFY